MSNKPPIVSKATPKPTYIKANPEQPGTNQSTSKYYSKSSTVSKFQNQQTPLTNNKYQYGKTISNGQVPPSISNVGKETFNQAKSLTNQFPNNASIQSKGSLAKQSQDNGPIKSSTSQMQPPSSVK